MHSTSPGPTSVCCPSSVQLRTPSSPYIVSSKPSWLCAPGTLAPAATSNSKTATQPPEASPSSRNRIAIPPILISSFGLASMGLLSARGSFREDVSTAFCPDPRPKGGSLPELPQACRGDPQAPTPGDRGYVRFCKRSSEKGLPRTPLNRTLFRRVAGLDGADEERLVIMVAMALYFVTMDV